MGVLLIKLASICGSASFCPPWACHSFRSSMFFPCTCPAQHRQREREKLLTYCSSDRPPITFCNRCIRWQERQTDRELINVNENLSLAGIRDEHVSPCAMDDWSITRRWTGRRHWRLNHRHVTWMTEPVESCRCAFSVNTSRGSSRKRSLKGWSIRSSSVWICHWRLVWFHRACSWSLITSAKNCKWLFSSSSSSNFSFDLVCQGDVKKSWWMINLRHVQILNIGDVYLRRKMGTMSVCRWARSWRFPSTEQSLSSNERLSHWDWSLDEVENERSKKLNK